ncbi:tail fiber assembly protein [Serratia nevei]|uniref:tail fiber assembly protein n=1 Tax=Serratia nevei TaxID=2703794 RepID=UPI003017DFF0
MFEEYFFSAKTKGFYLGSEREIYESSSNGWPDDLLPVSYDVYQHLFEGQAQGKVIVADDTGRPILSEPPEPTHAELVAMIEAMRSRLMTEATEIITPLQDAVDINIATKQEQSRLVEWKKYRVLLNRVDVGLAPDIIWPEKPS